MRARAWAAGAVLFSVGLSACGGSSSAGPSPAPPAAVDFVPTSLRFVSGETGQPVAGARVVVAGQSLQADASGQVAVPVGLGRGAFIDIVASGFLDRQTQLRGTDLSNQLTLWPRTSAVGLDENFTAVLVYTDTGPGTAVGSTRMIRHRPGSKKAYVRLSSDLAADPEIVRTHEAAVGSVNDANGGLVLYQLVSTTSAPPTDGVLIDVSYNSSDPSCVGARGFTAWRVSGSIIIGATIVYCIPDAPRSSTVVHELGHSFGLEHSPGAPDVMFPNISAGRGSTFTARERLAMRLMMQRSPGSRFPDNDRDTTGETSVRTLMVLCPDR